MTTSGEQADSAKVAVAIPCLDEAKAIAAVVAAWREALPETTESWLVKLAGAGHLLAAHPEDPSTARGFLETPTDADPERLRAVLSDVVTTFLKAHLAGEASAKDRLADLAEHHPTDIADVRRR